MSTEAKSLSTEAARALLDMAGVTLPDEEVARFAQAAGVMRALAAAVPGPSDLGDEPAVIFDPLKAGRA